MMVLHIGRVFRSGLEQSPAQWDFDGLGDVRHPDALLIVSTPTTTAIGMGDLLALIEVLDRVAQQHGAVGLQQARSQAADEATRARAELAEERRRVALARSACSDFMRRFHSFTSSEARRDAALTALGTIAASLGVEGPEQ